MTGSSVTLGQLLAMGLLRDHEVFGGSAGLDRPVRMVVPGGTVHTIEDLGPGTVVVFGPEQLALDALAADLAIRLAHGAGLSGIIAQRPPGPVPLVTRRLADKLAVPLVGVAAVATAAIAAIFDPYVRAPEIAGLRMLGTTAQRFQTAPVDAAHLTRTLAQTLGGPVVLVDGELRHLAGADAVRELLDRPEVRAHLAGTRPSPGTFVLDDADTLLVHPVQLDQNGPAISWLATRLRTATGALLEPIRQSMGIAVLAYKAYVARATAELERESRRRSLLLGEILDQGDSPSARTVERATALGWRLAGRHTAVQMAVKAGSATLRAGELVGELEERLAEHGHPATLVERPDGWVFWTTVESDGGSTALLRDGVRSALSAVETAHVGLSLCAGIGATRSGTAGLRQSLDDARRACLLAQTEDRASVEHVDAVSMKRLLVGWYSSSTLRSVAAEVLNPLVAADPTGELVRTLRRYLDQESSPTETAAVLGVHRNTVMQRLDRIRALLPVDLDDPDDRIAVHLATRAVGVDWADGP